MATYRGNIGVSSGGYPTGRSPLAFDLSNIVGAITQRMVSRKQQELAAEKEEELKNEALILKALDFETIQGIGEKVQQEHMKNLNSLWDKWADIYSKMDGKIGMMGIAALQNDKNAVMSKLKTMQTDVLQTDLIRKMIIEKKFDRTKHPDMDLEATESNYIKYLPNIGSGKAMDIIAQRYITAIEDIDDYYGKELFASQRNAEEKLKGQVSKEGMATFVKSNISDLQTKFDSIIYQDPRLREKISKEGYDNVLKQVMDRYGINTERQRFYSGIYNQANKPVKGTLESLTEADRSEVDNMNYYLEALAQADVGKIKEFISGKPGIVNPIVIKRDDGQGNWDIQIKYDTGKMIVGENKVPTIDTRTIQLPKIPKVQKDPKERERLKRTLVEQLPFKIKPELKPYIFAKYEDYVPSGEVEISDKGQQLLSDLLKIKTGTRQSGGRINPRTFTEKIVEAFPDLKNKVGYDRRTIKIMLPDSEGNFDWAEFNISNPEHIKLLNDFIIDKSKNPPVEVGEMRDVSVNEEGEGIIDGIDISKFATLPGHENKISRLSNEIKDYLDEDNNDTATIIRLISDRIQDIDPNSPITSEMIITASDKYNIPISLIMAILEDESLYGTRGVGVKTKNPGNVGNDDEGNLAYKDSWEEGIDSLAEWLHNHKIENFDDPLNLGLWK